MTYGQKKLKLSISGNAKKTISNIEQAKSSAKNSVIINNNKISKRKNFINHSTMINLKRKSSTGFKKHSKFFSKKRYIRF